MRNIRSSFLLMLKFARRDMMLFAAALAPLLSGAVIRFGIPALDRLISEVIGGGLASGGLVLEPYYGIFDVFLASLTPAIFGFVVAMIMLEERDEHIDRYLYVTGLGVRGYYISRLLIPSVIAYLVTVVLLPIFKLTNLSLVQILILPLAGTIQGVMITLITFLASRNKLEGMAATKMASLLMFGVLGPYFVPAPVQYCLAFMPSYWMGIMVM